MPSGLQIGGTDPTLPQLVGIKSALGLDLAQKPVGVTTYAATTIVNSDIMGSTNIVATGNFTLAISGSPVDFQMLQIRITASGNPVVVTFPFRVPTSSTISSPLTIPMNTKTAITFRWDATGNYWGLVNAAAGYPLV